MFKDKKLNLKVRRLLRRSKHAVKYQSIPKRVEYLNKLKSVLTQSRSSVETSD